MSSVSPSATANLPASVSVLHVDDQPEFLTLTSAFLSEADSRLAVESVTSPQEALDRLATADFDCIVSDYDMPVMNGLTFLSRVRETHPRLPFILFTGSPTSDLFAEALANDVTDIIPKSTGSGKFNLIANRIVHAVSHYRSRSTVWTQPEATADCQSGTIDFPNELGIRLSQSVSQFPSFTLAWIGDLSANKDALYPEVIATDVPDLSGAVPTTPIAVANYPEINELVSDPTRELLITDADPMIAQGSFSTIEHGTSAIIPLVNGGEVTGILGINSQSPDQFGTIETELLEAIASYANHWLTDERSASENSEMEVMI